MMLSKQAIIDARLVIEPLRIARRHQLYQILIPGIVFTQQNQMAVFPRRAVFFKPVLTDVHLAADHGRDIVFLAFVIEIDHAVHHAMVGDRGMRLTQRLKALHHIADAVGAVEQAVFRMQMQVGKGHEGISFFEKMRWKKGGAAPFEACLVAVLQPKGECCLVKQREKPPAAKGYREGIETLPIPLGTPDPPPTRAFGPWTRGVSKVTSF